MDITKSQSRRWHTYYRAMGLEGIRKDAGEKRSGGAITPFGVVTQQADDDVPHLVDVHT